MEIGHWLMVSHMLSIYHLQLHSLCHLFILFLRFLFIYVLHKHNRDYLYYRNIWISPVDVLYERQDMDRIVSNSIQLELVLEILLYFPNRAENIGGNTYGSIKSQYGFEYSLYLCVCGCYCHCSMEKAIC